MLANKETCPVCASEFICELQQVRLDRQDGAVPQFFCMECRSFYHRSGYQEEAKALREDTQWLIEHPADYTAPIAEIRSMFPHARTAFEAGCGAGGLLHQLQKSGFKASGIDPNHVAVAYAAETLGVDARVGYFGPSEEKYDLIFCIDVMEHLEQPRPFFRAMGDSLNEGGALAVRVPTVDRGHWQWLRESDTPREFGLSDPWCVNSVHITHFSTDGLRTMAGQLGLPHAIWISQGIVIFTHQPVNLVKPEPEAVPEPESLPEAPKKRFFAAAGFSGFKERPKRHQGTSTASDKPPV